MPLVEVEQGSPEWMAMRAGGATASRMADVMAKLKRKDGEAQCRADYKAEIVCERLTGLAYDHYVSPSMQWGTENEPLAKAAYEIETGMEVSQAGLAMHDKIKWLMASPDGLVGDEGLVETKCPNTSTHIEYIIRGEIPSEYYWQMMCQMACTGRKWCDFVSYDPRLPKKLQLFVRRLERDEAKIAAMEAEVEKFLGEVDELIAQLHKRKLVDLDGTLETKLRESLADA